MEVWLKLLKSHTYPVLAYYGLGAVYLGLAVLTCHISGQGYGQRPRAELSVRHDSTILITIPVNLVKKILFLVSSVGLKCSLSCDRRVDCAFLRLRKIRFAFNQ